MLISLSILSQLLFFFSYFVVVFLLNCATRVANKTLELNEEALKHTSTLGDHAFGIELDFSSIFQ